MYCDRDPTYLRSGSMIIKLILDRRGMFLLVIQNLYNDLIIGLDLCVFTQSVLLSLLTSFLSYTKKNYRLPWILIYLIKSEVLKLSMSLKFLGAPYHLFSPFKVWRTTVAFYFS